MKKIRADSSKPSPKKKPVATKSLTPTRLNRQRQKIVHDVYGDCFRACMASVLELPADVLPNDHSPLYFHNWERFLYQFGLGLVHGHSKGPIWLDGYWIATVPSLNFKEGAHAIVMHDTKVFHDPARSKHYKSGTNLLGKDVVIAGTRIFVTDASQLHRLNDYRQRLLGTKVNDLKPSDAKANIKVNSKSQRTD